MKIKIKDTPEQLALIKQMASNKRAEAVAAQELFAELLGPTLGQVLQQVDTTRLIYEDLPYNSGTNPSIPVEPLLGAEEGIMSVWSQSTPGGLPTNTVYEATQEIFFTTYKLDSAISWLKKYAQETRLPIIAKYVQRLLQEILVKRSRIAWSVFFAVLANAQYNGIQNLTRATTAGVLTLDDINKIFTRIKRQNQSWAGGTPETPGAGGLTDLVISPEIMEFIRSMTWNPINTRGANNVVGTQYSGVIAVPDEDRAAVFHGAGMQNLLGVNLIELQELGKNQKYNILFDQYAGSTTYVKPDGSGSAAFDGSAEELIIGLNLNADAFAHRAVETNSDTGSQFSLVADDQFFASRSEKIGQYGSVREGALITTARPISGLIV